MRWVSRPPPRPASGDSAVLSFVSFVDCVSGPGKVGVFSSLPLLLICFQGFASQHFYLSLLAVQATEARGGWFMRMKGGEKGA